MSRRPLPTVVKKARGEKRKVRLNEREAQVPIEAPECPAFLRGEAKDEWDRMVPKLLDAKLLTKLDGRMLAEYCQLHATQVRISEQLEVATGSDEARLVALQRNGANALRLFLIEFGQSPAARSKVKTAEKKTEDPLEAWQQLKQAHMVKGGKD